MTDQAIRQADSAVSQPHGWSGSVSDFLASSPNSILDSLISHLNSSLLMEADESQVQAWKDEIRILGNELGELGTSCPNSARWGLILEYELPRERGRRPDVTLLADGRVVIVEFKGMRAATRAAIDQIRAYRRDVASYHAASHHRDVMGVLVLTRTSISAYEEDDIFVTGVGGLGALLGALRTTADDALSTETWLASPYSPLPSLVTAARRIFDHEPLPAIRRAQSAGIAQTIRALESAALEASEQGGRHLALVTGVPGAGKTLVGLQFVYATRNDSSETENDAVFLSGNGPLVKVLQHALKSTVFVQDVHGFLRDYGGTSGRIPRERIWVYDEAQRAWDAERVQTKRGHGYSEPEDFIRLGERVPDWALVVGLIGEGQEIHLGEESGLGQWNDAISNSRLPWTVHCPSRLSRTFDAASDIRTNDSLDLTTSLRSHLATDVQQWVNALLLGDLGLASEYMRGIRNQGFDVYATRDLEEAKAYVAARYQGESTRRYGLLGSSKARNLERNGVNNSWAFTKNFRAGPWYNDDPGSRNSCCQLVEVATEFSCQGLELDMPIVCWGDDLIWQGAWIPLSQPRSTARNPNLLRLNSYRVLLSRGRDGMVIWVPPDAALDSTFNAIRHAGAAEIT